MKKSLLVLVLVMTAFVLIARPAVNQSRYYQSQQNREFQWEEQNSNFPEPSTGINYMHAVDENVVWATGYDGSGGGSAFQIFTRTTDGGASWNADQIDTAPTSGESAMIFAIDENKAWVQIHSGNPQGIYYTDDGGESWNRQESADYNYTASFPNVVHFFNENDGFAQGDPVDGYYELYTTTDGGANWTRVPEADIPAPLAGEWGVVGYYDAVGDNIWWGTNTGRVFRSNDKGFTWEVSETTLGGSTYTDVRFKDELNGIAQNKNAASTGTICETSDGGVTWQEIAHSGDCFTNSFDHVPGTNNTYVTTGAATGFSGASYSHDGGHNWTTFDETSGLQFLATSWIDAETGWAGCFNDMTTPSLSGMYKYTGNLTPEPMGTVEGVVTDLDSGTPIEDAVIMLGDAEVNTNEAGEYSFFIETGIYTISCEYLGFENFNQDNVEVAEGQTTTVDIELQNLLLPPADLELTETGANILLQWENPETNAAISNVVIYRNDEAISAPNGAPEFFVDSDVPTGVYTYYVTVMYFENYESAPSNEVEIDHVDAETVLNPSENKLIGNTPNPFNPTTAIAYQVTETGFVNIQIYNLAGQKVKTLVNEEIPSGVHSVVWNGMDDNGNSVSSGIYLYRLKTAAGVSTKKMLMLK